MRNAVTDDKMALEFLFALLLIVLYKLNNYQLYQHEGFFTNNVNFTHNVCTTALNQQITVHNACMLRCKDTNA